MKYFFKYANHFSQVIHLSFRKYKHFMKPSCLGLTLVTYKTYFITHNLLYNHFDILDKYILLPFVKRSTELLLARER